MYGNLQGHSDSYGNYENTSTQASRRTGVAVLRRSPALLPNYETNPRTTRLLSISIGTVHAQRISCAPIHSVCASITLLANPTVPDACLQTYSDTADRVASACLVMYLPICYFGTFLT